MALQRLGVKVVHDLATDVDSTRRTVKTRGGRTYGYERLVLAPGIAIKYGSIGGYSHEAARAMPHAYTTNPAGNRNLKRQLQAMRDGGTVVIAAPNNPYRCPPAPYERACMIAHYLKARKPKSKLVILDAKKSFAKQSLFIEAFERHYQGIIELNLSTEIDDFSLAGVDPKSKEVITRANKRVKADVANIIPAQRTGDIAVRAGCADGDWCPIDPGNFASRRVNDIYVLGRCRRRRRHAKVGVCRQQPGKGGGQRHPRPPCRQGGISSALSQYLLVAGSHPMTSSSSAPTMPPRTGKLEASGEASCPRPARAADVRRQAALESVDWYDEITTDMFARPQRGANANSR